MPPAPSSRMISYWPRRAPTPGARKPAGEVTKGAGAPEPGAGVAKGPGGPSGSKGEGTNGEGTNGEGTASGRSGGSGVGRGALGAEARVPPTAAPGLGALAALAALAALGAAEPPTGETRVPPPLGGRGSISPDTSLPFS